MNLELTKSDERNNMTKTRLETKSAAVGLMITAGCFLAGCATAPTRLYTGPELPETQVAKICIDQNTPPPAFSKRTSDIAKILTVDGVEMKGFTITRAVEVLPGRHEILARIHGQGPDAFGALGAGLAAAAMDNAVKKWDAPLKFTAEAGKTYMIRFEFVKGPDSPAKEEYFNRTKGMLWVYWVEEATAGKFICGWRPEDFKK